MEPHESRIMHFHIPGGLDFSDLDLHMGEGGLVHFQWRPIEVLCEASGIDAELFKRSSPENVATLISKWYAVHLINGGRPDPVQEEALSCSETEHWGPLQYVHAPGHA